MKRQTGPHRLTASLNDFCRAAFILEAQRQLERRRLSWRYLCQLEPELESLREELLFDPSTDWDWDIKPRLSRLVGWHRCRLHSVLSTYQAYDLVCARLLALSSYGWHHRTP